MRAIESDVLTIVNLVRVAEVRRDLLVAGWQAFGLGRRTSRVSRPIGLSHDQRAQRPYVDIAESNRAVIALKHQRILGGFRDLECRPRRTIDIDVFLHEAGHAMFDLLKVPLLGREEDAADQVAAYLVLQLPKEQKRGLVLGNAYSYASELKVRRARDLSKRRFEVGRQIAFADEHGTPAQRLYNLLCVAYGSNARLFADVVEKGYLPKERAEGCPDEYKQIDFAYRRLISPHIDARR